MKAMRYHEYGDVSVLRLENVDRPVPGPGQVLVRVAATSFNPVDAGIRAGLLRQVFPVRFPHTPGLDFAGTVAELGAGVGRVDLGDEVIGFLPMTADGAAADFVLAPSDVLTAAPTSIPLTDAGALPVVGLTAWQALFEHAGLRTGQRVLINGAGGAVGGLAVQLAKQVGAVVIATVSPRSTDTVRGYGADEIVDHTTARVHDVVTEPVDVVLNLVPAAKSNIRQAAALLPLVRSGGVFVTAVPPVPSAVEGGARVIGMSARSDTDQLAALVNQIDHDHLHVDVAARLPLTDIASVHVQRATPEPCAARCTGPRLLKDRGAFT